MNKTLMHILYWGPRNWSVSKNVLLCSSRIFNVLVLSYVILGLELLLNIAFHMKRSYINFSKWCLPILYGTVVNKIITIISSVHHCNWCA